MNYKLMSTFIEISERKGLIENNSTGLVEVLIKRDTDEEVMKKIIEPSGKFIYSLKSDETLMARALNRIYSYINVLKVDNISGGGGNGENVDLSDYYTKFEVDTALDKKIDKASEITKEEALAIIHKYTR